MKLLRHCYFCALWIVAMASPALCAVAEAAENTALVIKGAPDFLANNIRQHVGDIYLDYAEQPRLLDRYLEEAVESACQSLGFYQCEFDYQQKAGVFAVDLRPGPEVVWATSSLELPDELIQLPAIASLLRKQPFHPGKRMEHRNYDTFKRQLLEAAHELGFLDASYEESRLLIDVEQGRATAILKLTAGPRYRIGSLQFSGTRLTESLLYRLSPFREGAYVRRSAIARLQRNLQDTRYFSDIDVDIDNHKQTALTDVIVTLTDAPSHLFNVGLGFGTDTGPRTILRWTQPQVTRGGHRWVTEGRFSSPIQEFNTTYRIPLEDALNQHLNLSVDAIEKDIEDGRSQLLQAGLNVDNRLSDKLIVSYGTNYEWERFRQGAQTTQQTSYLLPRTTLLYVSVPQTRDPTRGSKTALSLAGSGQDLGADIGFFRLTLLHKRLISLGGHRMIAVRGELGTIITDDLLLVPASKRFFTGGDQTVRGYRFESIASQDSSGELIGGKHLNVLSLEYSDRLSDNWRAAVFTDAGRAYSNSREPWRKAVGVGVRWLSPVGQISFDIAVPVNDREEHGPRLHLVMGAAL